MAYTYALNVIRKRTVNGHTAFAGVSYEIGVSQSTAFAIMDALGLLNEFHFVRDGGDICSVQVETQKILKASIDLKQQKVNDQVLGLDVNLEHEITGLLNAQRDIHGQPDARVFFEFC